MVQPQTENAHAAQRRFEGERTLMRIHIGESDKWHGKLLYEAIVQLLRAEGFSGVTVLRGVGGYGSTSVYHTEKILRLSQDLPIVLEAVEFSERIEQILPKLDEMIGGGLITLEKVRVILYRSVAGGRA
jgi:PII-like signaling protein